MAKDKVRRLAKDKVSWPAWYYGPKGEAAVFQAAEDVPQGWLDHPTVKAAPKRRGRPPKVAK